MGTPDTFRRYEIKFRLTAAQEDLLKKAMQPYMEADPHGNSTNYSLYYDTPDFRLIRRSMEKPFYKEKLRLRSYGNARPGKPVFIELKKKYDGVIYKRRISAEEDDALAFLAKQKDLNDDSQISREIRYWLTFYPDLAPAIFLSYEREAFYSKTDPGFRLTFDRNIRWRNTNLNMHSGPDGQRLLSPDTTLLEVKAGEAMPLWLIRFFDAQQIRRQPFSKVVTAYQCMKKQQSEKARFTLVS